MPKLLLADDSVTIQRVIELTFSGEDVQVVAVGDGDEAIARIPTERPDIVLADIGMPKRSGYDVAAFVKGDPTLAHIPVLLLAGAFEPVDQARADQVRCDGVLVKPFEPQQVIARVRELVNGSRKRPDRPRMPEPPPGSAEPRSTAPEPRPSAPQARVIDSRPVVEIPDPRGASNVPPGADAGDSLDDYFDRLDAAFASLGGSPAAASPPPSPTLDDLTEQVEVPTIDDLIGAVPPAIVPGDVPPPVRVSSPPVEPPDASATMAPGPPPPQANDTGSAFDSGRNVIADVFSALLAAEQGDPDATKHIAATRAPHAVTDELVEDVTRRVLERLAPGAARDLVAQVVSEIAERLVREEIARIRGTS